MEKGAITPLMKWGGERGLAPSPGGFPMRREPGISYICLVLSTFFGMYSIYCVSVHVDLDQDLNLYIMGLPLGAIDCTVCDTHCVSCMPSFRSLKHSSSEG